MGLGESIPLLSGLMRSTVGERGPHRVKPQLLPEVAGCSKPCASYPSRLCTLLSSYIPHHPHKLGEHELKEDPLTQSFIELIITYLKRSTSLVEISKNLSKMFLKI